MEGIAVATVYNMFAHLFVATCKTYGYFNGLLINYVSLELHVVAAQTIATSSVTHTYRIFKVHGGYLFVSVGMIVFEITAKLVPLTQ